MECKNEAARCQAVLYWWNGIVNVLEGESMSLRSRRVILALVIAALLVCGDGTKRAGWSSECTGEVLVQPVCDRGTLAGWETFVTAHGTIGEGFPQCVRIDMDGDGIQTESVRVKVGRLAFGAAEEVWEGGGLEHTLHGTGRRVDIGVGIAVEYRSPADRRNLAGGLFELLVDGKVIARHDFGPIESGTVRVARLEGSVSAPRERYRLSIRIRRPFESRADTPAPYQYVGPITITDRSDPGCRSQAVK